MIRWAKYHAMDGYDYLVKVFPRKNSDDGYKKYGQSIIRYVLRLDTTDNFRPRMRTYTPYPNLVDASKLTYL